MKNSPVHTTICCVNGELPCRWGSGQLICFVRAMVYDPEILVLDEATSSVDSETEELVSRACERMMKGRTSIVIAHRLSTIRGANKILVMHKGEIREKGSHDFTDRTTGWHLQKTLRAAIQRSGTNSLKCLDLNQRKGEVSVSGLIKKR